MGEVIPIRFDGFELLHPLAVRQFSTLRDTLERDYVQGKCGVLFRPYETYRTPQRQYYFFQKGTSRAMPFRSAHQFGLAVDFVPFFTGRGFSWDAEAKHWDWLRARATEQGLSNVLSWDRAHVEHAKWKDVRAELIYA